MLCGVRILDKSRDGRENNFRIEIWTKFSDESDEVGQKMKTYIESKLVPVLMDDDEQKGSPKIAFSSHKPAEKKPAMDKGMSTPKK